jgi:hypothetical protein
MITYGKGGNFHPIINKWGREWVVPEPGEGVLLLSSNDLRARGRIWSCHYQTPLTFEPDLAGWTPVY